MSMHLTQTAAQMRNALADVFANFRSPGLEWRIN